MNIKCASDRRPINDKLNVFITIRIRNSWIKIDSSAEKFFLKNMFYFAVLKQKKHVFFKKRTFVLKQAYITSSILRNLEVSVTRKLPVLTQISVTQVYP